jgi:hypothetical protein
MNWINGHGVEALAIYYVVSAVIGGMPTPPANASLFYQWAFRSGNILTAGFARLVATDPAIKALIPGVSQKLTGSGPSDGSN